MFSISNTCESLFFDYLVKIWLKSHYLIQFKPSKTKIFQIYFQKLLARKLFGQILNNFTILVLLGLNMVFFVRDDVNIEWEKF